MSELRAGDPAWIGPFWLRERLDDGDGADGIGPAYLGQSPLEELVTIRALRPDLAADKSLRARLTRDIAAAREVAGPHVAPLAAADLAEYAPWIGWEWVPGESLAQTVAQHGPLSWLAFEALAAGLAAGISAIHEAGVVHGNLTPGSVFLAKDGAVITGFGVSAAVTALRAAAGSMPGAASPPDEFLSPEQATGGEPTSKSDVFSLGAVLAYALCGQGPFSEQARAGQPIDYAAPVLNGIPSFLRPLIAQCLREDPGNRPPSSEIATTISAGLAPARTTPRARTAGRSVRATPARVRTKVPVKWGRLWLAAASLLIIAIIRVALLPTPTAVAPAAGSSAPRGGNEPEGWARVTDIRTGDCFLGDVTVHPRQWPDEMWRTPCTELHNYEVFYVNFHYWPASERFPGLTLTASAADAACSARLASYEDPAIRSWGFYTSTSITPGKDDWAKGQRGVLCAAYVPTDGNPNGGPVSGSISAAGSRSAWVRSAAWAEGTGLRTRRT